MSVDCKLAVGKASANSATKSVLQAAFLSAYDATDPELFSERSVNKFRVLLYSTCEVRPRSPTLV